MVSKGVILQTRSGRKRKRSREDNSRRVKEGGARLQETRGEEELNQMDQSVESVDHVLQLPDHVSQLPDHVSHLPDHVIHHILSLLRNVKDAVRTSVLSKRWRSLWYSLSILIFDERKFNAGIGHEDSGNKEKMFRDYVSNSLQIYHEKNLYLQKLVVHMASFDSEAAPHIDHWLSVAREKNIKELDLHVGSKNCKHYTLPEAVFSSTTMIGLRLSACKLVTCNDIMLPHLQKLNLRKIHLVENIIQSLISSCRSIEDLRFIQCSGLKHLQIANHFRLNRVEIHHCNQLKKVEVSAPNLHTFWYCGKKSTPCKVSLEGCKSLKRLTLEHPQVTRDFCENQISNFPLLEKLDLSMSNKMKYLILTNQQLQRISLEGYNKLGDVLIHAPNLVSFEYKGETVMPHLSIYPFCLTHAKLSFERKPNCKNVKLFDPISVGDFIKQFDPEGFKLVLYSNKNIVIHEDLNNIRLPPFPEINLEIIKSSACIEGTLYSLLRKLHPVSLSIISPSDSKFPELVYEMIKNKDKDPICCKYNTLYNKCWRHFLKDVMFEDLKDFKDTEADEDKKTSNWNDWLVSSSTTLKCQMSNLRLYWNSQPHGVESPDT